MFSAQILLRIFVRLSQRKLNPNTLAGYCYAICCGASYLQVLCCDEYRARASGGWPWGSRCGYAHAHAEVAASQTRSWPASAGAVRYRVGRGRARGLELEMQIYSSLQGFWLRRRLASWH